MEKKVLSIALINDIGNYLAQRPYREVAQLLARMQQEINQPPVEQPEKPKEEK